MLFLMSLALMPLGVIALFASVQSAKSKRLQHEQEAQYAAAADARQIEVVLLRRSNILRIAGGGAAADPRRCEALLADAAQLLGQGSRIALFGRDGSLLCGAPALATVAPPPRAHFGVDPVLLAEPGSVRLTVGAGGGAYAVGEVPASLLRAAVTPGGERRAVSLRQGATMLPLAEGSAPGRFDQATTVTVPLAERAMTLVAVSLTRSISPIEVLLILMPLLMWVAAAVIGWIVVNELLLRPLGQLQRAVAIRGEDGGLALPRLNSPAREIRDLGAAFASATEQIAQREVALAEALHHQVKLTREVHHRVKNNLQVVASLINLHARGTQGAVAAAYASIQRRVDALAIVHRNHFAELEANRGVALRALVAELTGNLRATAPPTASHLAITLDMMPAHVSQDVAVPVAFLVTEIVELVIECAPAGAVEVSLAQPKDDRALLSVVAPALGSPACREHPTRERFERIVAGLARQLRAPLTVDAESGSYAIAIQIVPQEPAKS